jgi:hypothetical protein
MCFFHRLHVAGSFESVVLGFSIVSSAFIDIGKPMRVSSSTFEVKSFTRRKIALVTEFLQFKNKASI